MGCGNGDQRGAGGGGLQNGDDAGAVGLAGVKKDGLGDDGEAGVVAERHGGFKGRFEGGQMVVAESCRCGS